MREHVHSGHGRNRERDLMLVQCAGGYLFQEFVLFNALNHTPARLNLRYKVPKCECRVQVPCSYLNYTSLLQQQDLSWHNSVMPASLTH